MSDQPTDIHHCPICGEKMRDMHRYTPPTMSVLVQLINLRWSCAQSDGQGNRHFVEIERRGTQP
jgi:hypothetical protein